MPVGTAWCHWALHGDGRHCTVLVGIAWCHWASHGAASHGMVPVGTTRHRWALNGDARHGMVPVGIARCRWALHGDARHGTVLLGTARRRRALHGAIGHCTVPLGNAWVRARHCPVPSNLARRYQASHRPGAGNARCIQAALPSPSPVPTPSARCSPAAGSAGSAVSGALFSAREALAQQMAGITKQLAAAKPIIYLIMIYHLTT